MIHLPEEADVPKEQQSEGNFYLRYEDISQEGQLKIAAMPNAFGDAIWRSMLAASPMYKSGFEQGILPILSRFVLEGAPLSISPQRPLRVKARYQLARSVSSSGETERLFLNFWASIFGKPSHPLSPTPDSDELALAGKAFGEHIFTRPFGSKEERKVLSLDGVEGAPKEIPIQAWSPAHDVLRVPEGATLIDSKLVADETPTIFGLVHTDPNQHVNSLVYPRLFEEALLRRLAVLNRGTSVLAKKIDIRYRKPCFAGERLRVWLQLFEVLGGLSAVGILLPEDQAPRPDLGRCFVALRLG